MKEQTDASLKLVFHSQLHVITAIPGYSHPRQSVSLQLRRHRLRSGRKGSRPSCGVIEEHPRLESYSSSTASRRLRHLALKRRRPNLVHQTFPKHTLVSILCKVHSELGVLTLQISVTIRDEHPRDDPAHGSESSANKEDSLSALLGVSEGVLNGCENLRADSGPGFPDRGGEAHEMPAKRCREGFRGAEEGCYARTHLAEGVEDPVQNDEERKDGLDLIERPADDEAQDGPEPKTKTHSLFAADTIHEQPPDQASRQVETIHDRTISDILD